MTSAPAVLSDTAPQFCVFYHVMKRAQENHEGEAETGMTVNETLRQERGKESNKI